MTNATATNPIADAIAGLNAVRESVDAALTQRGDSQQTHLANQVRLNDESQQRTQEAVTEGQSANDDAAAIASLTVVNATLEAQVAALQKFLPTP